MFLCKLDTRDKAYVNMVTSWELRLATLPNETRIGKDKNYLAKMSTPMSGDSIFGGQLIRCLVSLAKPSYIYTHNLFVL